MDKRRVLVVDDELDVIRALGMGLAICGYEVHGERDGLAALAAALEFRPHAAVIDIALPGITGWELATRLRSEAELAGLRLVALTGRSDARAIALAAGFDRYLVKPASLTELRNALAGC
jgi:DNA-binding response OmpR family regulator